MPTTKIHLTCLWKPSIFSEEVEVFQSALKAVGYNVSYTPYHFDKEAVNIVFGAFAGTIEMFRKQADRIIIRNLEHVTPDGLCMMPNYIELMKAYPVWDYCPNNVTRLVEAGVTNAQYLPVCYDKALEVVQQVPEQDIDVYFYGNLSTRRAAAIEAIRQRGLNVVCSDESNGAFGEARNQLIARAKLVLNIGLENTENRVFEMVRVGFLLANHKAVVAEVSPTTDIEEDILPAIAAGTIEELPALCEVLVQDTTKRQALEKAGHQIFSKRNGQMLIGGILKRYLNKIPVPDAPRILPKKLVLEANWFSGWRYNCLNANSDPKTRADFHWDISQPLEFGKTYSTWRFGDILLSHGMVDHIVANNFFGRTDNFVVALTNCLNLLSEGGTLDITLPYDLHFSAWGDPRVKRAFNESSFGFSSELAIELGWREFCFESQGMSYLFGDRGAQLLGQHQGNLDELKNEVRAFEWMRIHLVKRRMTWSDQERYQFQAYYRE